MYRYKDPTVAISLCVRVYRTSRRVQERGYHKLGHSFLAEADGASSLDTLFSLRLMVPRNFRPYVLTHFLRLCACWPSDSQNRSSWERLDSSYPTNKIRHDHVQLQKGKESAQKSHNYRQIQGKGVKTSAFKTKWKTTRPWLDRRTIEHFCISVSIAEIVRAKGKI